MQSAFSWTYLTQKFDRKKESVKNILLIQHPLYPFVAKLLRSLLKFVLVSASRFRLLEGRLIQDYQIFVKRTLSLFDDYLGQLDILDEQMPKTYFIKKFQRKLFGKFLRKNMSLNVQLL